MKFLIVLAVVLVAVWLWRLNRRSEREERDAQRPPPAAPPLEAPQDMVRCPVCNVHLPRTDALPGPDGRMYCCDDHRVRVAK